MPKFKHVLLITIDGLRLDETGSDTLTRLSREGASFSSCRSTSSRTLPGIATLLTGAYPFRHGVRNRYCLGRARNLKTIYKLLRDAGFATLSGFDGMTLLPELCRASEVIWRQDSSDRALTGAFERRRAEGRRVFAHLHLSCVRPDQNTYGTEINKEYERLLDLADNPGLFLKLHLAMVRRFDRLRLSRLINSWSSLGLLDDSLVSIVSTRGQGPPVKVGQDFDFGEEDVVQDDTLRVPWILWSRDGELPRGGEFDLPCSIADVAPTLLDLLGVGFKRMEMDGISRAPLLLDPKAASKPSDCYSEAWRHIHDARDETLSFYYTEAWVRMLKTGDEASISRFPTVFAKFLKQPARQKECRLIQRSVIGGDYKLVVDDETGPALYDTTKDPKAERNLVVPHPDIVRKLSNRLILFQEREKRRHVP